MDTLNLPPSPSVITQDFFDNVIITAFEGGVNYWAVIDTSELDYERPDSQRRAFTEILSHKLFTDPEFKFTIYDAENPDEVLGILTQHTLLKGIQLLRDDPDYIIVYQRFLREEYDANDADIVLQFALFGEQVFG